MSRAALICKSLWMILFHREERGRYGTIFIHASEGRSFDRTVLAVTSAPEVARLLSDRLDPQALLLDRARLRNCPSGSLGQRYAAFMDGYGIDENLYFADARDVARRDGRDAAQSWIRIRTGSMHDLNHLLAGYAPNPLGEACVLAFRFAQLRHYGVLALAILAMLNVKLAGGRPFAPVREAYRRGRDARRVELLPWEERLDRPLADQRASLGITPTRYYREAIFPQDYIGA